MVFPQPIFPLRSVILSEFFLFFEREDFQECTSYCSQNVLFYLFKFPKYKEFIKIYLSISLICIIEDPLEKETATHSSILAWKTP